MVVGIQGLNATSTQGCACIRALMFTTRSKGGTNGEHSWRGKMGSKSKSSLFAAKDRRPVHHNRTLQCLRRVCGADLNLLACTSDRSEVLRTSPSRQSPVRLDILIRRVHCLVSPAAFAASRCNPGDAARTAKSLNRPLTSQ